MGQEDLYKFSPEFSDEYDLCPNCDGTGKVDQEDCFICDGGAWIPVPSNPKEVADETL